MNTDRSSYESTANYINHTGSNPIHEKDLVDTLQLGLAALAIIEKCQFCKNELLKTIEMSLRNSLEPELDAETKDEYSQANY
jgi:hypothetical protein